MKPDQFGAPQCAVFGVFDGHGHVGEKCARFVMAQLPIEMKKQMPSLEADKEIHKAMSTIFVDVNQQLHQAAGIDDTLSGTTGVVCYVRNGTLYVANVGDSRCVIVQEAGNEKLLSAKPLSTDQTPYRRDERARVRKCGARVLNMDQLEGLEAIHDDWDMSLGEEVNCV